MSCIFDCLKKSCHIRVLKYLQTKEWFPESFQKIFKKFVCMRIQSFIDEINILQVKVKEIKISVKYPL